MYLVLNDKSKAAKQKSGWGGRQGGGEKDYSKEKEDQVQRLCSIQFSSVTQLYPTLCDPMGCSMPGFSVHHQLPEFAQTHVHRVGDAIQPSYRLSSPSPPAFNLCLGVKNLPANVGDMVSIPDPGRSHMIQSE